jgi:hypothetical protein
MADTRVLDPAPPASARTWRTGGALLLLSVVIGAAALGASGPGGFALLLGTAVLSAGLLVLALGRGSVTARRPLGTIALSLLAVWLLVGAALQDLVQANLQLDALTAPLLLFAYGDAPVQLVLALVAAVAVARAGVVPPAWRWAPAWSVLAIATSWLLYQLLVSITIYSPLWTSVLLGVDAAIRTGSVVLLGVLAILAADRTLSRTDHASAPDTVRIPA